MEMELLAHDLYLRHVAGDGKSYIAEHRVWDRFPVSPPVG